MDHTQIVREVTRAAGLTEPEEGEASVRAVLSILSGRLSGEAAEALGSRLPPELRSVLQDSPSTPAPDADHVVSRLAERLEITPEAAMRRLRGVWKVLVEAVGGDTLAAVGEELPEGLGDRLITAPEAAHRDIPEHRAPEHVPRARQLSEAGGNARSLADDRGSPRAMADHVDDDRRLSAARRNPNTLADSDGKRR